MPMYDYACSACGNRFEVRQSMKDDPLMECPRCQGRVRRVIHAPAVVFKGSGFYKTDSRSTSGAAASAEGKDNQNGQDPKPTKDGQDGKVSKDGQDGKASKETQEGKKEPATTGAKDAKPTEGGSPSTPSGQTKPAPAKSTE